MTVVAPIFGGDNSAPSTSAANFNWVNAQDASSFSATEANRSAPMPVATTLDKLYVELDTAPGVGTSYAVTVYKNGSATALTATISGTATSATDTTNSVSFAAGDTISIGFVPTGTPAAPTLTFWNMRSTSSTGQPLLAGNTTTTASNTATSYINPSGTSAAAGTYYTTATPASVIVPTPGTLSGLRVALTGSPASGKSYALTLVVNGTDSALTATVADTATTAADTTHSVTVAAGDLIALKIVPAGTPTARGPKTGLLFTPDDPKLSMIGFGTSTAPSSGGTNYEQVQGVGAASWSTTQSARANVALGDFSLKKVYVAVDNAPTATLTLAIQKSLATTALAVTLTGATTSGSATADVGVTPSSRIDLVSVPSGTPASVGGVRVGLLVSSDLVSPPPPPTGVGNFFHLL